MDSDDGVQAGSGARTGRRGDTADRRARNRDLARRRRQADEAGDATGAAAAMQRLVDENRALAAFWARRYAGVCVQDDYETLERLALTGLEQAASTWDPDGGATFAGWSAVPIRSRLQRRVVALYGRRLAPVAHLVVSARREIEQQCGRTASVAEVGERCGLTDERVAAIEDEVAAIRRRVRAVRIDDDRYGDRRERLVPDPGDVGDEPVRESVVAHLLQGVELPARWRRLARHVLAAGTETPIHESVASYAAIVGITDEDAALELSLLVEYLGDVR